MHVSNAHFAEILWHMPVLCDFFEFVLHGNSDWLKVNLTKNHFIFVKINNQTLNYKQKTTLSYIKTKIKIYV